MCFGLPGWNRLYNPNAAQQCLQTCKSVRLSGGQRPLRLFSNCCGCWVSRAMCDGEPRSAEMKLERWTWKKQPCANLYFGVKREIMWLLTAVLSDKPGVWIESVQLNPLTSSQILFQRFPFHRIFIAILSINDPDHTRRLEYQPYLNDADAKWSQVSWRNRKSIHRETVRTHDYISVADVQQMISGGISHITNLQTSYA